MMTYARIVFVLAALLVMPGAGFASEEKDDYPYLDFGALSSKAPSPKGEAKSTGKASGKKGVKEELPTWQQAFKELAIAPEDQSEEIKATPATVITNVEAVKSPVPPPSFAIDFALEPYRPSGRLKLAGYVPYELDSLGTRPMPSLAFRWVPFNVETENWFASFGLSVAGAFTQYAVDLRSPTGERLRDTRLSALRWQGGLVGTLRASADSPWGVRAEGGVGELNLVQSSAVSIANHSAKVTFASLGIYGERRIWSRLSAFAGLDYRIPVGSTPTEIEVSSSNFKLGISGDFN